MNYIDLKKTKNKLAIDFALIIFFVTFILVFIYFSFKFLNIMKVENQIFSTFVVGFEEQKQKQGEKFLNNFFNRTFEIQKRWYRTPLPNDRKFMIFEFIIVNEKNEIIFEDLKKYVNFEKIINFSNLPFWKIVNKSWILFYKIDIWNNNSTIFTYFYSYPLQDYWKDLLFFTLLLSIFSFLFYYIWLYFAGKNLKPVEETLSDMTDFIHNANHELKTPISVINSNLQLIKTTKNYEEDLIENSILEIKRIDNLLWELSHLSDINSIWNIQELDIKKEIQEIILEYQKEIDGKKLNISLEVNKNTLIKANKEYFYILFSNLLRNAIKYNKENWEIKIILDKNKMTVSNTWEWILKEDLPNIFDRFFKGEKSRNSEWFGIWLSLVKKICDIYNWKIKVTSDEKMTSFEIKF